ncbi:melanopsin-like [Liolophura sinensis]|uniref:melanopsin-like n=1 Tax=Liolophura sinensis TaxID=3198878 RepID=UPI003158376E
MANLTGTHNLRDTDPSSDDAPTALTFVKVTYYTIASVVAMIGNGLLITTVVRRYTLRKVSYFLVANLAFKDFAFALVSTVFTMPSVFKDRWMFGHHLCVMFGFISTWLAYVELLTLVCLASDRYVAVTRPLRYHQILSRNKFRGAVAFCWSYSFLWAALPLVGFGEYVYYDNLKICQLNWSPGLIRQIYVYGVGSLLFFPGTGMIIYCYINVYRRAKSIIDVPVFTVQTQANGNKSKRTGSRGTKATFTIALITGIYFFCWFPFVGVRLTEIYYPGYKDDITLQALENFTIYSFTIANFINPIIYGIYNKEFRHELFKLIRR